MTYHLPETAPVGIAVLGVSLPTIICCDTPDRRGVAGFRRDVEWANVIPNIPIDLGTLFLVILGNIKESVEIGEGILQLGNEEQNTTSKGRLVQIQHLHQPLDKSLDSSNVNIVLHGTVEQVQVESLFGRGDEPGVKKRFVQGLVESVDGQLLG